jgi:FHA domain
MIKFTIEEFHRQKLLSSVQLSQVDKATIGRSIDCTYNIGAQFPDGAKAAISRVQCSLVKQGDIFLIDGAAEKPSQSGVYHNGKLIDSPMAVSIGDVFTVFKSGDYSVSLICQSCEQETASHAILDRIDVHSKKSDRTAQEVHEIHKGMLDRFERSEARLDRLETKVGEIGETIVGVVATNATQSQLIKQHTTWIFGALAAIVVLMFLNMADTTKRKDFADEIFPLLIKAALATGAGVVSSKALNKQD